MLTFQYSGVLYISRDIYWKKIYSYNNYSQQFTSRQGYYVPGNEMRFIGTKGTADVQGTFYHICFLLQTVL